MPTLCASAAVARELNITPERVRQLSAAGVIPSRLTPGGHRRYDLDEVREAVARARLGTRLTIEVPQAVKTAVLEIEPGADVILFGSRARGDARPDSDWDFLVLVDGVVEYQREHRVWDRMADLQLDLPEQPLVTALVVSRAEWETNRHSALRHWVEAEGLWL